MTASNAELSVEVSSTTMAATRPSGETRLPSQRGLLSASRLSAGSSTGTPSTTSWRASSPRLELGTRSGVVERLETCETKRDCSSLLDTSYAILRDEGSNALWHAGESRQSHAIKIG